LRRYPEIQQADAGDIAGIREGHKGGQPEISNQIGYIQQQLENLIPGCFVWYGLDHLHATLVAPLRGRYREYPPLQRVELPTNLQDFAQDLANFFAKRQPFSLELAGVHVTAEGFVMVVENTLGQHLASSLQKYPELDQPKHFRGLHVAIGFFNTSRPFATDAARAHFEAALAQLMDPHRRVFTLGVGYCCCLAIGGDEKAIPGDGIVPTDDQTILARGEIDGKWQDLPVN
jgi:hypothetical protein